jgi:hypothetical protein
VLYKSEFPGESGMLNRIVFNEHYETTFQFEDTVNGAPAGLVLRADCAGER